MVTYADNRPAGLGETFPDLIVRWPRIDVYETGSTCVRWEMRGVAFKMI